MRRWWVLLLVACSSKEPPPGPVPAPVQAAAVVPDAPVRPRARLVACAPAKIAPRVQPPPKHASAEPPPSSEEVGLADLGQGRGVTVQAHARMVPVPQPGDVATMSLGQLELLGGLDKAIVRRLIKRNISKLQFCYDRVALAKPGLAGTVKVQFFIRPDGSVAKADAGGVDSQVAACIATVVRGIQFPADQAANGAQVVLPITFRAGATVAPPPPPPPPPKPRPPAHVADVKVWTPYAAGEGMAPDDIAKVAAHDLEGAIAGKLDKLDTCFGDHTGSVRAMLTVAFDGGVISARVGGVGDHDVDACIAGALVGLKVSAPPIISEVSCDLERGAPSPWRLTLDGRYEVLELTKATPPIGEIGDASTRAYAIVAAPDVPASALARALHAVRYSQATLVATRADGGAPVFVGMGHDARTESFGDGEPIAIDLRGAPHACADREPVTSAKDPLAALEEHCAAAPCGTLTIALDAATAADQIALVASHARDRGFRVLVGGDGCAQPRSAGSASISGGSGGSPAGGSAPSSASPSSR